MRSPFPGLDPYLQRFWRDVHSSLVIYTRELLAAKLPRSLHMFVEERIVLEMQDDNSQPMLLGYVPDVAVVESKFDYSAPNWGASGGLAMAEPLTIRFVSEPASETFIEIRDAATGGKVITTIEFLSPTNKSAGASPEIFVRKRSELRRAGVSLVEIDLIRGGDWVLSVPEMFRNAEARTDLKISIIRAWTNDVSSFYPIKLNQRLPTIAIPLRKTDEPLSLDLQALFDLCYERGRYGDLIDYSKEPLPPLEGPEKHWADELLLKSGKQA